MSAYDTLSGHIKCWRADRPSEWIMDEFILKAIKLEAQLAALKEDNDLLEARVADLEFAARSLRPSQKEYMLNRGNDEIGKSVAEAAKYLDEVLGASQ